MSEIMDVVLDILSELHADVDFDTCDTLVDDKILDSFDIITIISEIADQLDVTISAEYIVPENFNSAEAIGNLVQKLQDEEY